MSLIIYITLNDLKIIINLIKDMDKTYIIVKKNGDAIRMKINEDKCSIMNNIKEN